MRTLRIDRRMGRWLNVRVNGERAVTVDVSEFGFCAELLLNAKVGDEVDGEVQVGGTTIAFRGEVAWMNRPRRAGERRQVGVRFTDIRADFIDLLLAPLRTAA